MDLEGEQILPNPISEVTAESNQITLGFKIDGYWLKNVLKLLEELNYEALAYIEIPASKIIFRVLDLAEVSMINVETEVEELQANSGPPLVSFKFRVKELLQVFPKINKGWSNGVIITINPETIQVSYENITVGAPIFELKPVSPKEMFPLPKLSYDIKMKVSIDDLAEAVEIAEKVSEVLKLEIQGGEEKGLIISAKNELSEFKRRVIFIEEPREYLQKVAYYDAFRLEKALKWLKRIWNYEAILEYGEDYPIKISWYLDHSSGEYYQAPKIEHE